MPTSQQPPPHFLVFVPGYLGSKLASKKRREVVWIEPSSLPLNPLRWGDWLDRLLDEMAYPNDDLEPAGVMDELLFVPPWAKQEHYGRLIDALTDMGYRSEGPEEKRSLFTFPYDWRQDNRRSAELLAEAVERWRRFHPGATVWILAHSNGGVVARWYIEKLGGKEHVGRLFLFGSPWDGTPKVFHLLFSGFDTLLRRRFNLFDIPARTRDLLRTFPSAYQLIPRQDPFLRGLDNEALDPLPGDHWLDGAEQRLLLAAGRRFADELGDANSVETLCFFGRHQPTTTFGLVTTGAQGRFQEVAWQATEAGDGTIPLRSAVHPTAGAKLPFASNHGDIYVDPPVLEFLRWELVDRYRAVERATLITEQLAVTFLPNREVCGPGELLTLTATCHQAAGLAGGEAGEAISDAVVEATLAWRQALPGSAEPAAIPEPATVPLWESDEAPGRYEAQLTAPVTEGYYQLQATVEAPNQPRLELRELIAVEAAEPDG